MKKAFVVGINTYKYEPSQRYIFSPLRQCVNDAEDLALILKEPDYAFEVEMCMDQQASLFGVRQGLDRLFAEDPEIALFYFSGHGVSTELGGYLVTSDAHELQDPGLDLDFLSKLIKARASLSTTVVVILDCCHAGLANFREMIDRASFSWRSLTKETVDQSFQLGQGKVLLAACLPDQVSWELATHNHGLFTYHLLDGLMGGAANSEGHVTPLSLYDYVSNIFTKIELQTPAFRGDVYGRIILGQGLGQARNELGDKYELSDEEVQNISRRAHLLVDEYSIAIAALLRDEKWKVSGFKQACARLEQILTWQDQKVRESKIDDTDKEFRRAKERTVAELARLGALHSGIQTFRGEIVGKLGRGAFGTVWKVKGNEDEFLAYKVYNPHELSDLEKRDRFERGYLAMKMLEHSQIVKVHEFTKCPIGFYMDYIDGPNLRQFYGAEQTNAELILMLFTIANTLNHAHNRDVIHRDVKPENILMKFDADKNQWLPMLTDFDLAWYSAATQATNIGMGAYAYAAPEQFSQPGTLLSRSATTDVYAFGQLAYFVLTKRDPIPSGLEENRQVLKNELEQWPSREMAQGFVDFYTKCSQIKPSNRFLDMNSLINELGQILKLVNEYSEKKQLSVERFLAEVKITLLDIQDNTDNSNRVYYSQSQLTRISIEPYEVNRIPGHINLRIDFWFQAISLMAGNSHQKRQHNLLRKVDNVLKEFPKTQRESTQKKDGTIVKIEELPSNFVGAKQAAHIISRIIIAIER